MACKNLLLFSNHCALFAGPSRYRAQSAPGPLSLMSAVPPRPFGSGSSDEDPYSVAGSGSSGSSGNNNRKGSQGSSPGLADRPPKLPPRDTSIYGASIWARPLESQLRYAQEKGGHLSRKDGNNNKKSPKRSTGGKLNSNVFFCTNFFTTFIYR